MTSLRGTGLRIGIRGKSPMLWRIGALCAVVLVSGLGCNSARMVRCDATGGTVAMPCNSNTWPYYHRDKAMALMQQKCPNGFEIVSEGEVVTGQVAHTNAQTNTKENPTILLGGKDANASQKPNGLDAFGGLAIPIGETKHTTQQTTTYRDVTEWRIDYRAK